MSAPRYMGGQAVLEGVMMRGESTYAVAVRDLDGNIKVDVRAVPGWADKYRNIPILRGITALGESLGLGYRALTWSANQQVPEEEQVSEKAMGVTVFVSVPWIAAVLGFYLPEGLFVMERPGVEDGVTIAAVHLGEHHGFMGTLLAWSALLLSRPAGLLAGRLGTVARLYLALAFAYGAVNMTQDAWNEQLWKRDVVGVHLPSALLPRLEPVWLVTLGVAAAAALALRSESRRASVLGG